MFFGNFHKATFDQYNDAMKKMMVDTDYLYGSLIKDIYYLGVILGRKYWLIRLAYNVFMIGIIVSVIAFVIAVSIHNSAAPTNNRHPGQDHHYKIKVLCFITETLAG